MKTISNKSIITSIVMAFVLGGVVTYFFLPERIETKIVEKVVDRQVDRQIDVKTKKTTSPDGTIVEEKQISSNTKTDETVSEKQFQKTETNPKRLLVYVGKDILHPADRSYIAGFSYKLWGPLDVGAQYNSKGNGIYGTIGIRF